MADTITGYTTFTPGTLIESAKVNENFSNHRGDLVPINSDTATASDNTHDLGSPSHRWSELFLGNVANFNQLSTTPSVNPTTGSINLYGKSSTGKIFTLDSAGTEVEFGGGGDFTYQDKVADYTATSNEFVDMDSSSATSSAHLLSASGISGARIVIKKTDSSTNTVTVDPDGSETVDGHATIVLNQQNEFISMVSDGTNWMTAGISKSPTVQRFTSGSGTYTTPLGCRWIRVSVLAGGGGGAADGGGNNGASGSNSTFGTSLLTANFGNGATVGALGGVGSGVGTVNSPAIRVVAMSGGGGGSAQLQASTATIVAGGIGGGSLLGGGAQAAYSGNPGVAAVANSGGGGGGAGTTALAVTTGPGGGAGGTVIANINVPAATYAYAVGGGGAGGTAGGGTLAGGAGGSGIIIVEEFY
jgi:hypothetical protein